MSGGTDLHNHVMPGVDDGASSEEGSRAAVLALSRHGVAHVVATPHVDGSLTANPKALAARLAELDGGWERLQQAAGELGVGLHRGAEIKLDLPEVDLSDPRLRLGGGDTALVEFAFMTVPPRAATTLARIEAQGVRPLLAHPERYRGAASVEVVGRWIDAGAFMQVNAGSLLGRYGRTAAERTKAILARGWAHCLASDYHARGEPHLAAAREILERWGGAEPAWLLFDENPDRLRRGEDPLDVPPLGPPKGLLERAWRMLPWTDS
jgi:protein-tyrosine phosphatase